jgi:hypothetical protein
MSCPLNRNRWAGSGYVKPTAASSELDAKIQQMLAERERQDATLYPQLPVIHTPTPKKDVQPKR